MRVELTIDGGFAFIPGLRGPLVVDGRQLSGDAAATLRRLCEAALAVATPPQAAPALPDARCYRLTVELDGARHCVTASDPLGHDAIGELIAFVMGQERGDTASR